MKAVLYPTNFWFWSGGMAQYLSWAEGSQIPYPHLQGSSWDVFARYVSRFYENPKARSMFERYLRHLLARRNTVHGKRYVDDPTIMSWELANEPRGSSHPEAMRDWVQKTACLIKNEAPNHLVTTGSEGDTSGPEPSGTSFVLDHQSACIDYMTFHLWVENWAWFDPTKAQTSYTDALRFAKHYIRRHAAIATLMKKPAVLEEFGIARDQGSHSPSASTGVRDAYYSAIFKEVYENARSGGALAGTNFWAWGGEGAHDAQALAKIQSPPEQDLPARDLPAQNAPVPESPTGASTDAEVRDAGVNDAGVTEDESPAPQDEGNALPTVPQDMSALPFSGDPPHEFPGWYSVYDTDHGTIEVIRSYAAYFNRL